MATLKAYAKVNLMLAITGVENGFHMLDGIMQTIGVYDIIDISVQEGSGITVTFTNCPPIEDDLCTQAAEAFVKGTGITAKIDIRVEKHIPSRAGLGGGSSDCACVITYLNEYFGYPIKEDRIYQICADLGADVPFFIKGGTQRAQGKGEILSPIETDWPLCLVVAKPKDKGVDTAKAFAMYDGSPRKQDVDVGLMAAALEKGDVYGVGENLYNALEAPSIKLVPEIAQVKDALMKAGGKYTLMTGSGSAVFGIFEDGHINEDHLEDYWYSITTTVNSAKQIAE